jgi:hypothetical protein
MPVGSAALSGLSATYRYGCPVSSTRGLLSRRGTPHARNRGQMRLHGPEPAAVGLIETPAHWVSGCMMSAACVKLRAAAPGLRPRVRSSSFRCDGPTGEVCVKFGVWIGL